ncbi:MAG: DUF4132 domain-containing protein, partial [Tannerella sp.]|nr:DUF4132 domain-containing protein [Tannerella sp.]
IQESFGALPCARVESHYGTSGTKRDVLTKLSRSCYPLPTDTPDALAIYAKRASLSAWRLAEAAVVAPQWLHLVEAATEIKGLESAGLFFHAHIGTGTQEKLLEAIRNHTTVQVEELRAGAFDLQWFRQVESALGEETFDHICKASKYMSTCNEHLRLMRSLRAVRGGEEVSALRARIEAKRNKEDLMNYALLPLGEEAEAALLERYEYLQQFREESKAFGSQKQESEKRAVRIALGNLARNGGYGSIIRLVWNMESVRIKSLASCFVPKEREGLRIYIKVEEEKGAYIRYVKPGHGALATVPPKLRKDPYVVRLRGVLKKLKSPYLYSTAMLEEAMEAKKPFRFSEVMRWMQHPVLAQLLGKAEFRTAGGTAGVFTKQGLRTSAGELLFPLEPNAEVRLVRFLNAG